MAYIPRSELTPKELAAKRAKGRAWYQTQKAKKLAGTARTDSVITKFAGSYFSKLRSRAKSRGISFSLTKEQLELVLFRANGKCALSGVDIMFATKAPNIASIDRIDSAKGYSMDNVQVVHADVNTMKMGMTMAEFKELCTAIAMKHD